MFKKGHRHTEKTKKKISIRKKGKRTSVTTEFKKGHTPIGSPFIKGHKIWFGRKHSKETRIKMKKIGLKHRGKNNPNWKGGISFDRSYIGVYKPNHPFCQSTGYVRKHRLVMERILGRYLKSTEIVHHINGNKRDNRHKNLKLCVFNKNWHPCLCPKCGFDFLVK